MPLVRVELPVGKPAEYRAAVGKAIQQAMHTALKVPLEERFHIFTEHDGVVDPKKMVTSYVASDAPAPSAG